MKFPFKKIGLLSTERCWWFRRFHPTWKTHGHGDFPLLKHTELTCALGLARNTTRNVISDLSPRVFGASSPFSSCYIFSAVFPISTQLSTLLEQTLIGWMKTSEKTWAWPLEERIGNRRKERKWWLMGFTTRRLSGVKRTAMNSPTTRFFVCPCEAKRVPWNSSRYSELRRRRFNQRSSRNSNVNCWLLCDAVYINRFSHNLDQFPNFSLAVLPWVFALNSKEQTAIWLQPMALHFFQAVFAGEFDDTKRFSGRFAQVPQVAAQPKALWHL